MRWIALFMMVACLLAHGTAFAEDVAGGHDHPALGRFPGSELEQYREANFDEAALPDKAVEDDKTPLLQLEGKVTRIAYRVAATTSIVELAANYSQLLNDAGFTQVFSCRDDECGSGFVRAVLLSGRIMPPGFPSSASEHHRAYLSKRPGVGGDIVVFIYLMDDTDSNQTNYIYEEVVEPRVPDTRQIKVVAASDLKSQLSSSGRVALYGLYFETDKSVVRPDSQPQLTEMGNLLRANPMLRVYIVGHTDNQGSLVHNLALSQQRADSVAQSLTTVYKIEASRLIAKGVASLAPVASNEDEAGRTRNRRVELVVQ